MCWGVLGCVGDVLEVCWGVLGICWGVLGCVVGVKGSRGRGDGGQVVRGTLVTAINVLRDPRV